MNEPTSQMKAARAVRAAYDAIREMCGEVAPCPAPFDDIYHTLMQHIFDIERIAKGVTCACGKEPWEEGVLSIRDSRNVVHTPTACAPLEHENGDGV